MYLHSLATAVPEKELTQRECWDVLRQSEITSRLTHRSQLMLRTVLSGDTGIDRRHFALPEIESVWKRDADELNEGFRRAAPVLAKRALVAALEKIRVSAGDVDALLICTCTGYLCPGLTSYVSEQMEMRGDIWLQDLVGLGCGAAIPMLRAAQSVLAAKPDALVACVAVEICSAAFYLDDDPGVLISACLFGDGAAASIWRSFPSEQARWGCSHFVTRHYPEYRDDIRFETRNGRLRNLLRPSVPQVAAKAVGALLQIEKARDDRSSISRIIAHTGGRDVLNAIEIECPGYLLTDSRDVLRSYGNMSSPSVLFALEKALTKAEPNLCEDWWMVSFGAGFSIHACRLGFAQT